MKSMRWKRRVLVCCTAWLLVGCHKHDDAAAPPATSPAMADVQSVTLTLNWKPEPEFGGFYAAQQAGIFRDHHLDVAIKPTGEGAPTWQLVATGKTDFAISTADQVLIARSQGADVVAFFAVFQTSPIGIMAHAARGFTTIDDVFTHPGTLAAEDLTWLHFMQSKFPHPAVTITSYAGGVAAFLAKSDFSQQCFVTAEPLQAKQQGGDPKTFLVAGAGYNPYDSVVIARGDTVRNNPALIKSVADSCLAGWRKYLDDPTATNALMGTLNTEMDAPTFAAAAAAQKPLVETDETRQSHLGVMTPQRWATLEQQLVDLQVITQKPDVATCFVDPLKP